MNELGFKVFCPISDNNRINKNMFEQLCGGVMSSFVANQYDPENEVFLLFDTVHILKCIRNS